MISLEQVKLYLEQLQKKAYLKIGMPHVIAQEKIDFMKDKISKIQTSAQAKSFEENVLKKREYYVKEHLLHSREFREKFPEIEIPVSNDDISHGRIDAINYEDKLLNLISEDLNTRYEHPANARFIRLVEPFVKKCYQKLSLEYPNIILSTLPHGEVNAWVWPVPESTFHLVLFQDSWLSFVTEALSIAYEYTLPPGMEHYIEWKFVDVKSEVTGNIDPREKIKAEAIGKFVDLLSTYFSERDLYTGRKGYTPIDEAQSNLFYQTRVLPLICFVIGHELGHISLGHTIENYHKSSINDKWAKEISADLFAFQTLLSYYEAEMANMEIAPYFIVLSYYNTIDILEKCESVLRTGNEYTRYSRTHPNPSMRKEVILRTVVWLPEEKQTNISQLIWSIEYTYKDMWERMRPFFIAMHHEGVRPKSVYKDDLTVKFHL